VTELGKFLDPLADKLLVITVLVILASQSLLPSWVVVVVAARGVPDHRSALGSGGSGSGGELEHSWARGKAFSQNCIDPADHPGASRIRGSSCRRVVFTWIAVIATIASGLDYLVALPPLHHLAAAAVSRRRRPSPGCAERPSSTCDSRARARIHPCWESTRRPCASSPGGSRCPARTPPARPAA